MQDCAKIEDSDNPAMAPTFTVLTSSDAVIGAFMIHQIKATSVSSQHLRHTTGRNVCYHWLTRLFIVSLNNQQYILSLKPIVIS